MKKNKSKRIGVNPEWVKKYIGIPLLTIVLVVMVITIAIIKFREYVDFKIQEEMNNKIIQDSISAEESIIAESKRAKAEAIAEEKAKQESLAKIEVKVRKDNVLYEDKITKKAIDGKKYWRNNKTMKVGKVDRIYGLEVITSNDWSFVINKVDGSVPKGIVNIGYAEYKRTLEKQKEQEEKKNQLINASKTQKLIDDEIKAQTEITKSKLGNYNHFLLNGKKYRLINVYGSDLIALEKYKKNKKYNYETITLTSEIKPIGFIEYETEKAK